MSAPPPPPPKKVAEKKTRTTSKKTTGATGIKAKRSSHADQIELPSVLVTKGHLATTFSKPTPTVAKMIQNVKPMMIVNNQVLYRLVDVVTILDSREGLALHHAQNHPRATGGKTKDFTGDAPPPGATPAELKTYFQAKQAEQQYIKTKNDNDISTGDLLHKDDVEKTLINAFKVVAHYMDNLGDILERDGVITHAEVTAVDASVDKIRQQLAEELMNMTNGKVGEL